MVTSNSESYHMTTYGKKKVTIWHKRLPIWRIYGRSSSPVFLSSVNLYFKSTDFASSNHWFSFSYVVYWQQISSTPLTLLFCILSASLNLILSWAYYIFTESWCLVFFTAADIITINTFCFGFTRTRHLFHSYMQHYCLNQNVGDLRRRILSRLFIPPFFETSL